LKFCNFTPGAHYGGRKILILPRVPNTLVPAKIRLKYKLLGLQVFKMEVSGPRAKQIEKHCLSLFQNHLIYDSDDDDDIDFMTDCLIVLYLSNVFKFQSNDI
jgi:hypothetical protein